LGGVSAGVWLYLTNDFGGYLAKFIFVIAVCLGFAVGIIGQYAIDLSKALFWAKAPTREAADSGSRSPAAEHSVNPENEELIIDKGLDILGELADRINKPG
jgi:hypothetical protein